MTTISRADAEEAPANRSEAVNGRGMDPSIRWAKDMPIVSSDSFLGRA